MCSTTYVATLPTLFPPCLLVAKMHPSLIVMAPTPIFFCHASTNYQHRQNVGQQAHNQLEERTHQIGPEFDHLSEVDFLNTWGSWVPDFGNTIGRRNEYYRVVAIYWQMHELFNPTTLNIELQLDTM